MARIFVAIPVSPELQNEIGLWQYSHNELPVRWTAGKNLHVTLVPPWEESDVDAVIGRLRQAQGAVRQFPITLRTVAYGPDPRHPNLIWAEGEAGRELVTLKRTIEQALDMPPQERRFRLHVTLARFRPDRFHSFPIKQLQGPVAWDMPVLSYVLMLTHRTPTGSDYEILAEFPFGAAEHI